MQGAAATNARSDLDWDEYVSNLLNSDDFSTLSERYVPLPIDYRRSIKPNTGLGFCTLRSVVLERRTVVLVGAPGAGKTTTVRALFVEYANHARPHRVPVYIKLADWGQYPVSEDAPWQKAFISAIVTAISPHMSGLEAGTDLSAALQFAFSTQEFLLIFDGLDELRDSTVRTSVARAIARFAAEHAQQQIVVAIRKYGFTAELRNALPFTIAEFARMDDECKTRLIERYAPQGTPAREMLVTIRSDFRLSRLTDVPMLLRLFAEHGGSSISRSRGGLFARHLKMRIAEQFSEPARLYVHELLTAIAEEMRSRRASDIPEHDLSSSDGSPDCDRLIRRTVENSKTAFGELTPELVLDRLLKTRVVEARERPAARSLGFSLPQYEDYYLARRIAIDLDNRLRSTSPASVLESCYITNREWHDPVVFAAGLLDEAMVERLVPELKDVSYLFLRGWILGEVAAPTAEGIFIRESTKRMSSALDIVLRRLSATCLTMLGVWAVSLVPATFLYNRLWSWNGWYALLALAFYLTAVPLLMRWVYPKLVHHYCGEIQKNLPVELTALSCLRSAAVDLALRGICSTLVTKLDYGFGAADPVSDVVHFAYEQIERCRARMALDAESILAQIAEDPELIQHYIRVPTEGFASKDCEVVMRYFSASFADTPVKLSLLAKLGDVAAQSQELRAEIEEFLRALAGDIEQDSRVRDRARHALIRLSRRPRGVIFVLADIRAVLRNGSLKRFAAFLVINAIAMAVVLIFVHGGSFFEKCKSVWPVYVGWCAVLAFFARVYLPRDIWERLKRIADGGPSSY